MIRKKVYLLEKKQEKREAFFLSLWNIFKICYQNKQYQLGDTPGCSYVLKNVDTSSSFFVCYKDSYIKNAIEYINEHQ